MKLKEAKEGIQISEFSLATISLKQTVLTTLGFSLLNPHVYLDTVMLIGGYSSGLSTILQRFYFGAGASVFSVIWFFGLALLASLVSRCLQNPKSMRIVSFVAGVILVLLALKLSRDVLSWISAF